MDIRIETQGFVEAFAHLRRINEEVSGERGTLYHDIGEIVDDSILANFAAEGRPTWPERSRSYDWPILNKTGAMGGKALEDTQNWEHGKTVHHLNIRSTPYGKYHQEGTSRLPMRKFVNLTPTEIQAVNDRIAKVFED